MGLNGSDATLPPRERLMRRVRESIERHRVFVTCRDDAMAAPAPERGGVAERRLHAGGGIDAVLVRLGAGAAMPTRLGRREEWLVLRGALCHDGRHHAPGAWLLGDGGTLLGAQAADADTRVFARRLRQDLDTLAPTEAAWWPPLGQGEAHDAASAGWMPFAPGVDLRPFRAAGEVMSLLARFAPGARLASHHHGLDEHCLMLEGELFLGDVLLRPGEYQLAPAGSDHGEHVSDVGCLLFFHGAVDPALAG